MSTYINGSQRSILRNAGINTYFSVPQSLPRGMAGLGAVEDELIVMEEDKGGWFSGFLDSDFAKAAGDKLSTGIDTYLTAYGAEAQAESQIAVSNSKLQLMKQKAAMEGQEYEVELLMLDKRQKQMLMLAGVLAGGLILWRVVGKK